MGVLVGVPRTGAMIVAVFHKVGESSFIDRKWQCFADVVVILVLIEIQWPPLVICSGDT